MDFISWAGVRHNRVAQLEPGPYDVAIAGDAERDQDQVGLIVGFKDSEHAYYRGSRRVTAERLDLSNLFLNLNPDLPIWHLGLVFNIITALNKYYGLAIDPVEISEAMDSFDYTVLPKPLTITAKDDAITCKGSVVLNIVQKIMTLSDIVLDTDADGVIDSYPLSNELLVLEHRYYNFDFTPWRAVLHTITDPVDTLTIAGILNDPGVKEDCGNITWDSGTYSTTGMTCVYNGVAADYEDANPAYGYVVVLRCPSSGTNGGRIFLHYA